MSDPFANMAATLSGTAPPALLSKAEATAARLARAAEVLRDSGEPGLVSVAEAFEQWLASGGDLARLLGIKAGRGRRHDLPAHAERERTKRLAVRNLVQVLGLEGASHREAAKVLAWTMDRHAALIMREFCPSIELPKSEAQIERILRDTKS